MALPPAEGSGSKKLLLGSLRDLPPAVRELDREVRQLLKTFWDEPHRCRAHALAAALADATAMFGLSHIAALARAIASLLRLRLEDTLSIQDPLREKLQ